jgi:drug/metabolite transporter (DMT)-like permease
MSISNSSQSLIKLHSSALLFGMAGLFGRWLSLNPLIIVLGRVFFASLALLFIVKLSKQTFRFNEKKDGRLFALLGFLLAFHWTAFFQAIQLSTLAIALFSFATFPLFTLLLEALLLKVPIKSQNLLLVFISLIGLYFVVPIINWQESKSEILGLLWGLGSAFSFALLAVANRSLSARYSSWQISLHQDFWATIFLLPSLFLIEFHLSLVDLALLFLLGTIFTALAHSLYIASLKNIEATTASLVIALEPVYGVLAAWLLFAERPSLRTLFGGVLILGIGFFVSYRNRKLKT